MAKTVLTGLVLLVALLAYAWHRAEQHTWAPSHPKATAQVHAHDIARGPVSPEPEARPSESARELLQVFTPLIRKAAAENQRIRQELVSWPNWRENWLNPEQMRAAQEEDPALLFVHVRRQDDAGELQPGYLAIPRGNFPEIYRLRRQIEETQQSAPMLQIMVKYVQDRVVELETPYGPGSVRVKSRPVPTGFAWDLCVRESEPVLAIDFPAHSASWMDPDSAEASLRDGLGLSLKSGR